MKSPDLIAQPCGEFVVFFSDRRLKFAPKPDQLGLPLEVDVGCRRHFPDMVGGVLMGPFQQRREQGAEGHVVVGASELARSLKLPKRDPTLRAGGITCMPWADLVLEELLEHGAGGLVLLDHHPFFLSASVAQVLLTLFRHFGDVDGGSGFLAVLTNVVHTVRTLRYACSPPDSTNPGIRRQSNVAIRTAASLLVRCFASFTTI